MTPTTTPISTEKYLNDILQIHSEVEELQKLMNAIANRAENCSDFEEYKESINSYRTN